MILVVDDDAAVTASIKDVLTTAGFDDVDVAGSAEEALEKLEAKQHDVVILDLVMEPGIGGMGFLERYQELSPHTQVIILTGYPSLDTAVPALSGGTEAKAVKYLEKTYLEKPVRRQVLIDAVNEAMTRLEVGDFKVDLRTHKAYYKGKQFHLSDTHFRLLTLFLRYPDRFFLYTEIAQAVYGEDLDAEAAKNLLKAHLWRVRKELRELSGQDFITTKRGRGFGVNK